MEFSYYYRTKISRGAEKMVLRMKKKSLEREKKNLLAEREGEDEISAWKSPTVFPPDQLELNN